MNKTQEELLQLKAEYEKVLSKLKELTEDELNAVIGGDVDPNSNLQFISPELQILSAEENCKPNRIKISKDINGKPYIERVYVCSDLLHKDTKLECVDCLANKEGLI